jgi:hypothetical protein
LQEINYLEDDSDEIYASGLIRHRWANKMLCYV